LEVLICPGFSGVETSESGGLVGVDDVVLVNELVLNRTARGETAVPAPGVVEVSIQSWIVIANSIRIFHRRR